MIVQQPDEWSNPLGSWFDKLIDEDEPMKEAENE